MLPRNHSGSVFLYEIESIASNDKKEYQNDILSNFLTLSREYSV